MKDPGWSHRLSRCTALTASLALAACGEDRATPPNCAGYDVSFASELMLLAAPFSPRPAQFASTLLSTSSYDRRSRMPETDDWFANYDRGAYLRVDRFGHGVLAEHTGAGALVRIWSANPNGRLRIYIDDEREPQMVVDMAAFLSEANPLGPAFGYGVTQSAPGQYGANLYVPITFERYIRVTHERGEEADDLFWQASLKAYEPGTCVESLVIDTASPATLDAAANALANPAISPTEGLELDWGEQQVETMWTAGGDGAELVALCMGSDVEFDTTRTQIEITFDGVTTVRAPVRDFFAGLSEDESSATFYTSYEPETREWCTRFRMPFRETARLAIVAPASMPGRTLRVRYALVDSSFEGSRYFHAQWLRTPERVPNLSDQRAVTISAGGGAFVGLVMALTNRSRCWWGEGDEKVTVDDEPFPRLFGTGTEDYFGYAWASSETFLAPFHGQPEADVGLGQDACGRAENLGGTWWNFRFHQIDAIEFQSTLRFDMEVWHWGGDSEGMAPLEQAFTGFWYGNTAQLAPSLGNLATRPGVWSTP